MLIQRQFRLMVKNVKVTPIEFKILELLMKNAGKVFSADDIYERVWNE